jgi:hypothetical protein
MKQRKELSGLSYQPFVGLLIDGFLYILRAHLLPRLRFSPALRFGTFDNPVWAAIE